MAIDPHTHVPIYEQIAHRVRCSIAAGAYRPHEPLPSIRETARELLVNPNTVQRAYDALERAGLVYAKRGVGLFVADHAAESAQAAAESAVVHNLEQALGAARAAGVSNQRVRQLFEQAIQQPQPSEGAAP